MVSIPIRGTQPLRGEGDALHGPPPFLGLNPHTGNPAFAGKGRLVESLDGPPAVSIPIRGTQPLREPSGFSQETCEGSLNPHTGNPAFAGTPAQVAAGMAGKMSQSPYGEPSLCGRKIASLLRKGKAVSIPIRGTQPLRGCCTSSTSTTSG